MHILMVALASKGDSDPDRRARRNYVAASSFKSRLSFWTASLAWRTLEASHDAP
jgi:hypothetical protein